MGKSGTKMLFNGLQLKFNCLICNNILVLFKLMNGDLTLLIGWEKTSWPKANLWEGQFFGIYNIMVSLLVETEVLD